MIDPDLFTGIFRLEEYNSHEVYEKVDTLVLKRKGFIFTGSLDSVLSYGYTPYQRNSCSVSGTINMDDGILTVEFSYDKFLRYNLNLKFSDGIYSGYYGGSKPWRDRWEKVG